MRVNWTDRSGINRRSFFTLVGLGIPTSLALTACGIPGIVPKPYTERSAVDMSADHSVKWSNWPFYIDTIFNPRTRKVERPTINMFERKTGIRVEYREDISDNDAYFGKIRPLLTTGSDPGSDLIVLSDWMSSRMERLGWVQPFNRVNIPNLTNIDTRLPANAFDPHQELATPYVYGLISIAYNAKVTGGKPVRSITQMLTDPDLRGKVALLTEMEQTVSLIMMEQGVNPADFTDDQFYNALDCIARAIKHRQIKAFTGNEYTQGLATGDYAACVVYSGDIVQLREEHPEIVFVFPESGAKVYTDNFLIPSYARHKTNAEKLINFYYDPEHSARLYSVIQYVDPIVGARQAMDRINPALAHDELIFPSEKQLASLATFKKLTSQQEQQYFSSYQEIIGV